MSRGKIKIGVAYKVASHTSRGGWGQAAARAVVALNPGTVLGCLGSTLCKELEDLRWKGDWSSGGEDALELLFQLLWGAVSQDCYVVGAPDLEAIG